MPDAFIFAAARTPIGKFLGGLAELSAPELGAIALKEAMSRAKVKPDQIDEAIFGNVIQAGLGQNPARQTALKAGLPDSIQVTRPCAALAERTMRMCSVRAPIVAASGGAAMVGKRPRGTRLMPGCPSRAAT